MEVPKRKSNQRQALLILAACISGKKYVRHVAEIVQRNPGRYTYLSHAREAKLSQSRPTVLTIAGFDPSSGAGLTADLKVFAAHRLNGLSAVTALTIQSTQGVRRTQAISPEFLAETLDCLADDITITGAKIGMLATAEIVATVAKFLAGSTIPRERIVLDPVIRSTSGRALLDAGGLDRLRNDLLPLVGWVTPNLDELAELIGANFSSRDAIPGAARELVTRYPGLNVVVTGGHLDPPDDYLLTADGAERWFPGQRIETTATHGTGCAFSSALLCQLVAGSSPSEAVAAAKEYVRAAMEKAYPIGRGHGPLNHLYRLDAPPQPC
jgi:hydroxymethylpyrimidine/phosphomethylpyrimidine kinase